MSHEHVLIVDDDDDIRAAVADVLGMEGFDVDMASNGVEALERLKNGTTPGMILLDMMMPVMDGRQFMGELRKMPEFAHMPVVIFSAYGNPGAIATELNAAGCLCKPFSIDELVGTVRRSIAGAAA